MIFELRKTSDWNYKKEVEINTLGELIKFCEKNGTIIVQPPIIGKTVKDKDIPPRIEIYDDWREG